MASKVLPGKSSATADSRPQQMESQTCLHGRWTDNEKIYLIIPDPFQRVKKRQFSAFKNGKMVHDVHEIKSPIYSFPEWSISRSAR